MHLFALQQAAPERRDVARRPVTSALAPFYAAAAVESGKRARQFCVLLQPSFAV